MAAALTTLVLAVIWAGGGMYALIESAPRNTPDAVVTWNEFARSFGVPPREWLIEEIRAMQGTWTGQVAYRWTHRERSPGLPEDGRRRKPLRNAVRHGGLPLRLPHRRSGTDARYRRIAFVCLGVAWTAYLLLGLNTIAQGFDQRWVYFASIRCERAVPDYRRDRLCRAGHHRGPARRLARGAHRRGRARGLHQLSRHVDPGHRPSSTAGALVCSATWAGRSRWLRRPPLVWLLMLAWSKPWLDRFHYGPLEWLWRSLARWSCSRCGRPPLPRRPAALRSGRSPGWRPCGRSRLRPARLCSGLVALSNSSIVRFHSRRSSTTSGTSSSGKRWVSMQRRAVCSISSAICGQRLGAELARLALQRVRGDDQRDRILLVHRLFDLRRRSSLHPRGNS